MDAKKAYQYWLASQKIRMQVMTDEQMFILGYQTAVAEMTKDLEEVKPKKPKVKKDE